MEVKRVGRPPDGGWGWMVMIGCFIVLMTFGVVPLGYSILFSDFFLSRGASSTTIAWIYNLHSFLTNAVSVFAGPLTNEFGFRRTCLVGCGLAAACVFALVFVDSLWGLFVLFPLVGLFGGPGTKPCFLLLTTYFDRKRGRANAILMTGISSAYFVGPLLTRHLLAEYGRQGATLLVCGVVLQCLVGAALFQPVEWHMKVDVEEATFEHEKQDEDKAQESDEDAEVREGMCLKEAEECKLRNVNLSKRHSQTSSLSWTMSSADLCSIPPVSPRELCSLGDNIDEETTPDGSCVALRKVMQASARVVQEMISNMKILRSPRALIIVVGSLLAQNSCINFTMMVPFAIQSAGYSLSDAAWCLSLAAVTNLVARLICSSLSDQPWFNIRFATMTGASILSITSAVFGCLQSLTHMQVAMVVWGCGLGIYVSLIFLTMAHFMGVENVSALFSVNSLMLAVSLIILGPLFGWIRDVSESYLGSMLAMGCCLGLTVLLWCFMPAAVAYDERKGAEQRRREEREGLAEKV